jgi:hypothetical protein
MDEPVSGTEQRQPVSDTVHGESRSVRSNRERYKESETSISHANEDYPDDDIDQNIKAFWEWLKREKIPAHGWITALSSIALLAVTFGQLVIACNNYRETSPLVDYARRNTEAAEKFRIAAEGINTHVGEAVGKLSDQVGQLGRQAGATEKAATASQNGAAAAQSASHTAVDTLHISERAYIVVGMPSITPPDKFIKIPLENTGRIPSGRAEVIVHEATFNVSPAATLEFGWGSLPFQTITSAAGGSFFAVPLPAIELDKLNKGQQLFMVAGTISYNDGFTNTPMQTVKFCFHSQFIPTVGQLQLVNCDPAVAIPDLEKQDEYPSTKYKKQTLQ